MLQRAIASTTTGCMALEAGLTCRTTAMSIVCEVVTPLTRATTWLATVDDSMSMSASSHRGPLQPSHAHPIIPRLSIHAGCHATTTTPQRHTSYSKLRERPSYCKSLGIISINFAITTTALRRPTVPAGHPLQISYETLLKHSM